MDNKDILENAPEGATHVLFQSLNNIYIKFDIHTQGQMYCRHKEGWRLATHVFYSNLRSLADIEALAAKDKSIAEFKELNNTLYKLMVSGEKRGIAKATEDFEIRIAELEKELAEAIEVIEHSGVDYDEIIEAKGGFMSKERIWDCTVITYNEETKELPNGADAPPRQAVINAIESMGFSVHSVSSGWGSEKFTPKIADLEREKQVLIKQHDMWKQQWHELNDSLAKRDLEQKLEAVNYIIGHDNTKCKSKKSVDCNAIHLADLHNYAFYLEQQLREQAKGGDL